ncbi:hypothetical protein BDQ12DRAFT_731497 [Crucibulum laeve]|uniref:BTB domain-containing protein n=1 Tax=Crucibulum laeve TaxID=68775 RepID=A0A5C3MDE4_9AGAR|nr:hypothetical protein BDQ12DRAFT_731497 [Crucibulum laeve]
MLSSTKPRSQTPRASHTPTHPPISYPLNSGRPSSQSTIVPPSPPQTPPTGRRPSISNTMHWLSRTSTQSSTSTPYSPSKPTRISEPKLARSIELLAQPRSGVLGAGATVVRTPDEALRETGVRLTYDGKANEQAREASARVKEFDSKKRATAPEEPPSPPTSPPLPPLPMPGDNEEEILEAETEAEPMKMPPRPTRAPPSAPSLPPTNNQPSPSFQPSLRPSLKQRTSSSAEETFPVPPLPANIPLCPSSPPFRPILMSEVPGGQVDPSKIIVTIETCTTTFKTTLETIYSRPSHLSSYVSSLFPRQRSHSTASSVYSTASDDMEAYHHHLASQGLLSQASFNLHIFLDRPSAPYTYILNYLRSPVGSLECPEILPRGVQLHSSSHARLDSLIELRDEAAYLKLDDLHKMCTDEIRLRHGPRFHTRGNSSTSTAGSVHSLHASVYSLHTLLERVESDIRSSTSNHRGSDPCDSNHQGGKDSTSDVVTIPARSPPTPQSWEGPRRNRSRGRHSPSRSPPAGWI